jgi:hypothetical protein
MLFVESIKNFEFKFQFECYFAYNSNCLLLKFKKLLRKCFQFVNNVHDKMCETHSIFFTADFIYDIMRY